MIKTTLHVPLRASGLPVRQLRAIEAQYMLQTQMQRTLPKNTVHS